jgi:uncharacterized RDD family membrane protein YckC
MSACPHCGARLPPVADAFCSDCGGSLDPVDAVTSESSAAATEVVPIGFRGVAGPSRFAAAWFDSWVAMGAGLTAAAAVPSAWEAARAVAIGLGFLAYYFVCEGLTGATVGKLACGLRVRRPDGGRCSWGQAAKRTAARVVEVNPLILAGLPAGLVILASQRKQRLGDMWAGTVVAHRHSQPAAESGIGETGTL